MREEASHARKSSATARAHDYRFWERVGFSGKLKGLLQGRNKRKT